MKLSPRLTIVTLIVLVALAVSLTQIGQVSAASIATPALSAPSNGATLAAQPVLFSWKAASGADYYRLQVSTSSDFANAHLVVNDGGLKTITSYNPGVAFAQGAYYWRVRGGAGSDTGPWSPVRSFNVAAPAPTVGPVSGTAPANNAAIAENQQPVLFSWTAAAGASYYRLQVSKTPAFGSADLVVNNGSVKTNADFDAGVAFAQGAYYWRVRGGASDGKGGYLTGEWSPVVTFTVGAGSDAPVIASGSPYAEQRPYSPDSIWNTSIPANPALDPNSAAMIGRLGNTSTGGKIYSDTTQYTYPVYFADASTPRYDVPCRMYKCTVVNSDGSVVRVTTMTNVPIPTGAQVSSGTDAQMIVVDTTTGMEYGFYHGRWTSGGYETDGGYQYNVNWNGTPVPFGSRGAGVTYYAGLIRPWEIRAGEINHAIAFAYDIPRGTRCVYPATQTDGTSGDTYALPEGARLQLNPALTDADFNAWGLSATGKIVARALQRYGMILIDTGGSPKIMAENLSINPLATESWDSLGYTRNVIANIPYSQFRVLDLPNAYWNSTYSPNYGKCIR